MKKFIVLIFFGIIVFFSIRLIYHIHTSGGYPYVMIRLSGLMNKKSNHFTEKYNNHKIDFDNLKVKQTDFLFIGDSHVNNIETANLFKNATYLGIPGDITSGVLNRIDSLPNIDAKYVILIIGLNDLGIGLSPLKVSENKVEICQKLLNKFSKAKIFVSEIPPIDRSNLSIFCFATNSKIQKTNILFKQAKQKNVHCINLYELLICDNNKINFQYFTDSIHFNKTGCKLFYDQFLKQRQFE